MIRGFDIREPAARPPARRDATAESIRRAVRSELGNAWGKRPLCYVKVLVGRSDAENHVGRLNHVAIAVPDAAKAAKIIATAVPKCRRPCRCPSTA